MKPLILCAMLALAGCSTVGSDFVEPAADAAPAWRHGAVPADSARLPATWWTVFGDDTLNALEERAVPARQRGRQSQRPASAAGAGAAVESEKRAGSDRDRGRLGGQLAHLGRNGPGAGAGRPLDQGRQLHCLACRCPTNSICGAA
ncbi:hypothetical protein LP419_27780 [Massilia sp. H-1]|nr:hypothetical protein LP419_27780 [Massilia sp. H-1]